MELAMKTGPMGIALIREFEGFSSTPYYCQANKLTIGYGHVIKKGEQFTRITESEAILLLQQDLQTAENHVKRFIKYPLTQNQFDALVSFTFNLGGGTLQRSTVRIALNEGDVLKAMRYLKKYVFAGGRRSAGLLRRRLAEIDLFMSDYQGPFDDEGI